MDLESKYFTLSMESLRVIGGWAADCAERALSVYEKRAASEPRPRAAIDGIREFAAGERRRGCRVPWPCRRFPRHARSATPRRPPRLARRALPLRAPSRTPWWMFIRQNTLSARRPMPPWLLSLTTAAIQASVRARSVGRLNTLPPRCARFCCRCPLVKRARVGWTHSFMHSMQASALRPCQCRELGSGAI